MIRFLRYYLHSERGSAPVVGFVLLAPLLAVIIYGVTWLGQMADVQNVVEEAARAGARWLAVHPGDIEGAKQKAADVVLGSYTVKEPIDPGSMEGKLIGKLTKHGSRYYIGSNWVKPANDNVRQQMEELLGRTVLAAGTWIEADVFKVKVATTDPPETQTVKQQSENSGVQPGTSGKQAADQVRHPGPFPAAALAKYGQGPWGTWWAPPAENTQDTENWVYEKKKIDFTDEGGSYAYWNPSFSAPSGTVIKEISFETAPAYDDYYTTQRIEGYKNGKWYVIKDYQNIHGNYRGSVSGTIDVSGEEFTKIRFNFAMYDKAHSAYGSPGNSYIKITYFKPFKPSDAGGWPDPEAWWIWGQPGADRCAPNGQEVTLTSPTWWTQNYAKYRLYATADDHFNVKIDNTIFLQGSGRGTKIKGWEPGLKRAVQFVVNARNDYGPAGFLFSMRQVGWHWPVSYQPQSISGGLVKYPAWTVPSAQWVTVTAKDRYGQAVPVYIGTGNQGNSGNISTGGALRLQVNYHRANVWSNPWSPPGGGKIKKIHIKGKSERNYDYGYVYGWNGSSWVLLAKRCSPGYNKEYDEWIDVSGKNITKIKTRLTTDYSVLYSPTYVDVPEVEVDFGWVASGNGTLYFYAYPNTDYFVCIASSNISTSGALRLQVSYHRANVWSNPWSPPGGGKIKRIHIKGKSERNYDYGYVYGWNGSSWVLLAKRCSPGYNEEYNEWIDVSGKNITKIKTRLTTDGSVLYSPTYVDIPEVALEKQSGQGYEVTVNLDGGVILHSDSSWQYASVDGVRYEPVVLPQKVAPGTEFTVKLSASNTARKEWFASRPSWWPNNWNSSDSWKTQFSYHWYDDKGNLVVQDGLRTALPRNVQPGETVTLDLKVKAPAQTGRYRLVIDGVQEYCAWFGPLQGVNWPTIEAWVDVVNLSYGVSYNPVSVPKYMEAGKTYTLQVTVKNTGSLTWTPKNRVGLAYHWFRNAGGQKGPVVIWDGTRAYVQSSVSPGGSYTFSLPVTAPSSPGSYVLELDMVHEGVTWFSQKDCPVVDAPVEVPQGNVLKGLLTFDGADYWVGNVLVRSAGPDLSTLAGRKVTLWGNYAGKEKFFRVTSVEEYFPGDWTAVITFDPNKDVLCNDPVRGDPEAPLKDPVGRKRTDGYAYCRVTYHYPVPLRKFWEWASGRGMWKSSEPPSRSVTGEAFFKSGEAGGAGS